MWRKIVVFKTIIILSCVFSDIIFQNEQSSGMNMCENFVKNFLFRFTLSVFFRCLAKIWPWSGAREQHAGS